MTDISLELNNEDAMVQFGTDLGKACINGGVIFLEGDLGAGKTTLCRGVICGLGHTGAVKSPTYTLVEPYDLECCNVYHFDLYRLGDATELEYMGIRDYFEDNNLCLVEWADRALAVLPSADLLVKINYLNGGRAVCIYAKSVVGQMILSRLQK